MAVLLERHSTTDLPGWSQLDPATAVVLERWHATRGASPPPTEELEIDNGVRAVMGGVAADGDMLGVLMVQHIGGAAAEEHALRRVPLVEESRWRVVYRRVHGLQCEIPT